MGSLGRGGSCDRDPVYLCCWKVEHWKGGESHYRQTACPVHVGRFAKKHDLRIPRPRSSPACVIVRRRDDEQQVRDVLARLARQVRALNRAIGPLLVGTRQGRYGREYPDEHEHRQELWGDVRGKAAS